MSPALAGERTTLHIPSTRYVLPNGLTVILHEDHHLPTVAVNIWFRVGSKDERTGRTGFAHLFEHLMFMGTHNVPNGHFDSIMEAAGGTNNASTSEDRTNYFEAGPANLLETFLYLEADRLSTLADDMTKEKVDLQRDVVKNERRQSIENRPYGRVELVLPENLFPPGHPYHHPVIGSHEDLTAASADDVKAFFHEFYVPSNASLVIDGDFRTADAKRLVDHYFAWMPKLPTPPHAAPPPVTLAASKRVELKDAVQLPRVVRAWLSPAWYAPGDAEATLLAAVLGAGKSSRLYQSLVYERKIAQSVDVDQAPSRYQSAFIVTATAQSGHTSAELEAALDEEIGKLLAKQPVTRAELERARAGVEVQQLRYIATPERMADALNTFEYIFGTPSKIEALYLGRFDAVDTKKLQALAKRVLSAPHVTIAVEPEAAK
ncbi:MAG TPA: pitrilysin family protein [Polyangia bacterium]|nr:pitrilysin family protein [Polyangia bacterium]